MTRRRIDREIVEMAIDELETAGKKVNINAIARATGYTPSGLGHMDYLRKYVKAYKPKAQLPNPIKQVVIEDTVESYKSHILSNYFSCHDSRKDVETDMMTEIDGCKASIFNQAVNQLLVEGLLQENKYTGKIITTQAQVDFESGLQSILNIQPSDNPFNDEPQQERALEEEEIQRTRVFDFKSIHMKLDDGFEIRMSAGECSQELIKKILNILMAEAA